MKHANNLKMGLMIFTIPLALLLTSITVYGQEAWSAPDKYESLKNPVTMDKSSISIGKNLYNLHCKSCHGKEGLGDGSKAAQLDTFCGDFTSDDFQSQSDGAIFYKIKIGRDEMPAFDKKLPDDEDLWHIVNFIRTLE